ncbi:MFS family permease [Sphingopyxis panaciterrae]|uniref:MFS transporter n=1 Tax=Sphingopyxis panaciterrae TaxID=363841 RepID=UPI0014214D2F|nr:MFS transporter [Sphingopyxis panaciterrae]NIJ35865.1 MFS family permease [Sphingopyxis panaciterrae]
MTGLADIELPAGTNQMDAGAIEKAPASAWYALAILIGTTLFAFVDRQIINLIAPSLQRDLGISDLQLGLLQGLGFALFASLAAYPIGWLSDRFGRRLVLGCCIMVWSISTAACAFQTSFSGIFAAAAGIAIGEAALTPVIFSMLPDLFPERQRNTANFIFFAVALLGAALGLALGGFTLDLLASNHDALPAIFSRMDSWRVALILVAAPGPLFVILLTTIRMTGNSGHPAGTGTSERAADFDKIVPFLREHWRAIACIYGAIFAYSLPLGAVSAWLPVAMPRAFAGVDVSSVGVQLGIAMGIGSITGLIMAPVGMKVLRGDADLKPLRLARFSLSIAALPVMVMLFAWQPWQIYAAVGVQVALLLATGALMPGVLQQLSPPHLRSRLLSLLGIAGAIAGGLAPMMVGAMSGLLDPQRGLLTAMVIVGLPAWILAAILMSMARRPFLATIAAIRG